MEAAARAGLTVAMYEMMSSQLASSTWTLSAVSGRGASSSGSPGVWGVSINFGVFDDLGRGRGRRRRRKEDQRTTCIHLTVRPRINLRVDDALVFPLLAFADPVLRYKIGRELDASEDGVGADVGVVDDAVGPQARDLGPRQQAAGPRPRGHQDVRHVVDRPGLVGFAVEVLDALDDDAAAAAPLTGDNPLQLRVGPHLDALFLRQRRHGRGEVVGMHLRRLRRTGPAHLRVRLDGGPIDPVKVPRHAARIPQHGLGGLVLLRQPLPPLFLLAFVDTRRDGVGFSGGLFNVLERLLRDAGLEAAAVDAPVTPSLLAAVLCGELLVQAVGEWDEAGRVGPEGEQATCFTGGA